LFSHLRVDSAGYGRLSFVICINVFFNVFAGLKGSKPFLRGLANLRP